MGALTPHGCGKQQGRFAWDWLDRVLHHSVQPSQMAYKDEMKKNHGGVIFESLEPGEFYRSISPGGFTDRVTGIHVPGPIVKESSDGTRMIEGVVSMPNPVQLPHFKSILDFKDKDRKIQEKKEVPFDRQDETPLHDGLSQALGTGIIEHVSHEDMLEFYPDAWAARKEHLVYDTEEKVARPMGEMISEYHKARVANDKSIVGEAQAALKTPLPPPVAAGKK